MIKSKAILVILIVTVPLLSFSQKLKVIKAGSLSVAVRDGASGLRKNAWTITPKVRPDVYLTQNKNAKVTFVTDMDSISFTVSPGKEYNFVILLNNRDSAFTQIKYKPSYLEVLKSAEKYNHTEKRELPKFEYQAKENTNLMALRKGFNLDSVTGNGNEVSKIINLMHWIHDIVPHDGQHGNPEVLNAMSMVAVCKSEKRGLNCRGLATVLNECYLSMGIPSRFVTCLPKDSTDDDCHVINMVYSKTYNKWLWIDPTNDAYVMNEKGELLSIEEVRERLISGKALIVNPDANWNHRSSVIKENYLYSYMAKNLYMLEAATSSEYDTETKQQGKTITRISLLPLDYYTQSPLKTVAVDTKKGTTYVRYKTNNPAQFWALPVVN